MTDINTIQVLARKEELWERRSFETDAALGMGKIVELNSDKEIAACTGQDEAIGMIANMPEYRAKNSTGTVASGEMAEVMLFGKSMKSESGGTFAAGMYVKFSAGRVIQTASLGTTVSQFIALEASTAANQIKEILAK